MGCFTVFKGKSKRREQTAPIKRVDHKEQKSAALPEPKIPTRSLQSAPPSFRTRVRPIQPVNNVTNGRSRAFSAPSSFDGVEEGAFPSGVYEQEQEESRSHVELLSKEQRLSSQPLPLPKDASPLKESGSFRSGNVSGQLLASGPLPLPPSGAAPPPNASVRKFSYEDIASACNNFCAERCTSEGLSSCMYTASFGDGTSTSKKFEATVTRLHPSNQGLKEFVNEVNILASLHHPNLCKLLGYHASDGSSERMLVYERLFHGSLDRLLYGRPDGPPIDWNTRVKIALTAAQGLTFLHEEGPFQAMYNDFSTANIQIDKDFSAKLSGYGCVGQIRDTEISNTSAAVANLPVETVERGLLTPKSNVWSFGIVLLELLTGRKNLDKRYPREERNLVKWSRPFLADDCRLTLVMDPQLKGRFPAKAARSLADIAQKCLYMAPSERPTMRSIVELLKMVHDMKYSYRFPLREPVVAPGKHMLKSPSFNGIPTPAPRLNFSLSPPLGGRPSVSPTRPHSLPLSLPPRGCSSVLSLEELERQEARRSSSTVVRRPSVEGF